MTINNFNMSYDTMNMTLENIIADLEFLDDWEERYSYIIDLGKSLPDFPEAEKTEENKVHGCQSQVWLSHYYDAPSNTMYVMLDSDAIIVKGLAAIVLAALNAKTPQASGWTLGVAQTPDR